MRDLANLGNSGDRRLHQRVRGDYRGVGVRGVVRKGVIIGALLLGVVIVFHFTTADAPACQDRPCTYFENGEGVPGKCGAQSGDSRCLCFKLQYARASNDIDRQSPAQPQRGCATRRD